MKTKISELIAEFMHNEWRTWAYSVIKDFEEANMLLLRNASCVKSKGIFQKMLELSDRIKQRKAIWDDAVKSTFSRLSFEMKANDLVKTNKLTDKILKLLEGP